MQTRGLEAEVEQSRLPLGPGSSPARQIQRVRATSSHPATSEDWGRAKAVSGLRVPRQGSSGPCFYSSGRRGTGAVGIVQGRAFISQVLSGMLCCLSLEKHTHSDNGCTCLIWVLFKMESPLEVYLKPTGVDTPWKRSIHQADAELCCLGYRNRMSLCSSLCSMPLRSPQEAS